MSDRYVHEFPAYGITFEVDRLRRDRHELVGELIVKCSLPGAITDKGHLFTADFNFSSARARTERANILKERARTNGQVDWFALLGSFTQKVFEAERNGDPAVDLRTLKRPEKDELYVEGLTFPRRHPAILFGDGGAAKSYTALFLAGRLVQRGMNVALFDWELCGEDHRERLERLFGANMPRILYCRCERPLTIEVDRLRRIVRENNIDYAVFDSIAFACDGPPEAAEVAGRYFRALREIGCGGLHIAHVSKAAENSDQKPFGSAFWHNGARSTWFVQAVDAEEHALRLGFFNRKANLGPLYPSVSYAVSFGDITSFERASIVDSPDLASKLTIKQRMYELLRRGSMAVQDLAADLDVEPNSIYKTVQRHGRYFILLEGGRVGLRA